ncbi:MAG: leucine-rich repeat domain-containing protein, partial [Clostridiales bacterium]|nr:leucine-rich repeat domain-containing protein [Clostridiales bacterium]
MKKAKNFAVAAVALFLVPALFSACDLFGVHKHKMTYVPALQPTCETTGMCEYWHCELCGENFGDAEGTIKRGDTPVKALGHSMVSDFVVQEPACTEGGLRRMKCSREGCDYVSYKSINYLGHDFREWEITSPTCSKDGKKLRTYKRDDCDETEEESIDATGNHKWADGEITKAATCTQAGTRIVKCLTCDQTKSVEIPATGHSYETIATAVSASCTTEGEDELTCATCNHVKTVTTPKTAHAFSSNNSCKNCTTKLTVSLNLGYQKNYGESSYSITSSKFVIDTDVVIPAYYGNLPVVEIKDNAFAEKKTIHSVFFPDTVTKIGTDAF